MTALEFLCEFTETLPDEWEEIEHPTSSVDDERWFSSLKTGKEFYVYEDQGEFVVSHL